MIAGYIALVVMWGTAWAVISVGVHDVPPFLFGVERNVLTSVVLTAIVLLLRLPWPRDRTTIVAAIVAGSLYFGVGTAVVYWSEQYVPSGLTSVFGASAPIWTALLAHFLVHRDRLSRIKVAGLILGLGGIAVLVGVPSGSLRPEALAAIAVLAVWPIAMATATIIQTRALRHGSPLPLAAIGSWASAVFLAPLALAQTGDSQRWTFASVAALAYLAVFSGAIGMILQLWLTRNVRPTTISLVQIILPAEALLIGAVALGEVITPRMLVGGALVLSAVALNTISGRPRRIPITAPAG